MKLTVKQQHSIEPVLPFTWMQSNMVFLRTNFGRDLVDLDVCLRSDENHQRIFTEGNAYQSWTTRETAWNNRVKTIIET